MFSVKLYKCIPIIFIPLMFFQNVYSNGFEDYMNMSLEELMNVEVYSAARRAQPIGQSASAIYVISSEDIRQAGVTHMGDLLRLVPGMNVSQTFGFQFQVGIRGFQGFGAKRFQILLDGKPLYDAYKAGAEFEFYPIFLENIERIEVIRGSGGVTWGVNAMNGVVNIITKETSETLGAMVYAAGANREEGQGFMRYGGERGPLSWRLSAGTSNDNGFGKDKGEELGDDLDVKQLTARGELDLGESSTLTIAAGYKESIFNLGGVSTNPIYFLHGAWEKQFEDDSILQISLLDTTQDNHRTSPTRALEQFRNEYMLELNYRFAKGAHKVVLGADVTRDGYDVELDPTHSSYPPEPGRPSSAANNQFSVYIEDEITLKDNLWFTLGTRQYYNEMTDHDWAYKTALVWEGQPQHYYKASVSRSFVRPSLQTFFGYENGTDVVADNFDNESLTAYALGYRGQLTNNFELSIESFYHQNKDLLGSDSTVSPRARGNFLDVDTYGLETSINYIPRAWWHVRASHSYGYQQEEDILNEDANSIKVFSIPRHTATLMNRFYLDSGFTINTQIFYTGSHANDRSLGSSKRTEIPSFIRFDFRVAKKFWNDAADIAVGANNLTDPLHHEGGNYQKVDIEVPRQYYVQTSLSF